MNGESPVQAARPSPLPAPRKDALGRSASERWIDRGLVWFKVVVPLIGLLVGLWFIQDAGGLPAISRTITRYRLAGEWSVKGTPAADWRFGSDGAFRAEGPLSVEGRYQLLEGDRLRIVALGVTSDYTYEFDSLGLLLKRETDSGSVRLTRKD